MANQTQQPPYLLGHSGPELERLERQSLFFDRETRDSFVRAGIGEGMRVLDIGCGAGDVSLTAARLVGPTGQVLGIDTSADAVAASERRFAAHGLSWASVRVADAYGFGETGFDAVIGRFILMHTADPSGLLRHLCGCLKPGAVVAFLEMDIESATITPPMALFDQGVQAIAAVYRASGSEPNMGSKLYKAFRTAGLEPQLQGGCRVEGGPDAEVYDYLARSVRSLSPSMTAHGIELPDVDLERYADRLKQEASHAHYCVAHPRLIAAWARLGATPA